MPKCRNCGNKFTPKYSSLEKFCTENPECINAAYQYAISKKSEYIEKKARKDKKDFNWKDPKWLKSNLQNAINGLVRSIDRGLACLATETGGQIHAGHIFSRGAHTQIRYNLHNIHRQSAYSNNKQSHGGLMQEKLIEEYGIKYLVFLKCMRGAEVQKWTVQELGKALKIARHELRELNKNPKAKFSKSERIKLRNQLNLKIGLYSPQISIYEHNSVKN